MFTTRTTIRGRHACAAALLVLLAGHAAHAQIAWTNPAGGVWSGAANWDGNNVPNNTGESALLGLVNPYTVQVDASFSINALSIPNALATLDVLNSRTFALTNGMSSNGLIRVNDFNGTNATILRVSTSQTWSGPGKVTLRAHPSNLDTAYITYNGGGEVLTLAPEKIINGSGNIYPNVTNNGGIFADVPGRVLQLLAFNKTNNAEIAAMDGGILRVQSITLNQAPAAVLRAYPGSIVALGSATVVGGNLLSDPTGSFEVTGTSVLNDTSADCTLHVLNSSELRLTNSLSNDGEIFVNDGSGANSTRIRAMGNLALNGNGIITLRSNGTPDTAHIIYNGGGEVVTHGPNHTIRGAGNIYVSLINNGLITASTPGAALRLIGVAKTNNSTISADKSTLQIDSIIVDQNPGGKLLVSSDPGAQFSLNNCTINGGQLLSLGNPFTVTGTVTLNATNINGPIAVQNNCELRLSGLATTHSGDLFVNNYAGVNTTIVRALNNHTLSGPGRIVLRAGPNLDTAYIIYNGGGEILTQQAGHSIVGTGGIYVNLANAGLVSADQPGKVLDLKSQPKTNSGTINAVNGGILQLTSINFTQTGPGALRADNASLVSVSSNISGGVIETLNAGTFDILGITTISNATLNGTARVPNNNELRVSGGTTTNNAVITVNPSAGVNGTLFRVMTGQTILGNGQIVLNANPGNLDTAYIIYNGGGEILTNSAAHTIRGTGRIYVRLTNNGTVAADAPGRTLDLTSQPMTNNAEMWARNGGNLQVSGINLTQASNASIRSESGSRITLNGANVSGGVIQTGSDSPADAAVFAATSVLSNLELVGAAQVPFNNELRLAAPGIINNAVLTINPTASNAGTLFRVMSTTTVEGTGTIQLNANPGNLDTGYLAFNGGGEILTLGEQQSIAGTGNIYVRIQNKGTLTPGDPLGTKIGRLNLASQPFTQTATGTMRFEIAGPSAAQFDRLTGGATLNLNGALNLALIDSYAPPLGSSFDIIDGPAINGTFAAISPGFDVDYFPNKVRVTVTGTTCPGDLNRDGVIDDADFLIFSDAYDLLLCSDPAMPAFCPADINRDDLVDDLDFQIFSVAYANVLCP